MGRSNSCAWCRTHQVWAVVVLVAAALEVVSSDINQDKQECANALAGLATCLPFVGGQSKAPTPDCCTGIKQVLKDNRKCLCILIKDRNDPSLGLKINATLALTLPHTCQAPANISECPVLLHLPPNDPDTKMFNDFAKGIVPGQSAPAATATTTAPATTAKGSSGGGQSANSTSDGGRGMKDLMAWMLHGVFLCCLALFYHLIF